MDRMTLCLGDVHGEFSTISHQLNLKKVSDCDIIQVGDFGLGFKKQKVESDELKKLNEVLKKKNINLYVIRGNHDDPERFKELKEEYSNIILVPDYSVFGLNGKTYMCIGGAISIDRIERKEKNDIWFHNEGVIYQEDKLEGHDLDSIDVFISHTAQNSFVQDMLSLNKLNNQYLEKRMIEWKDYSLMGECIHEQVSLDLILNKLPNVKQVFFGHFHSSFSKYKGEIRYNLLDIHELKEIY